MPLVSALAASHAPNILLEPGAEWEDFMNLHYNMAPQGSASRPTLEQQKKLRKDAEDAFAVLRADMEQAKPDVLIVVANDQFVNFFWNNIPTFFVRSPMRSRDSSPGTSFTIEITRNWDARSCTRGSTKGLIYPLANTSNYSTRKTCRFISFCLNPRSRFYPST